MLIHDAAEKYLQDVREGNTRATYTRCLHTIIPVMHVKDTEQITRDTFRRVLRYEAGAPAYNRLLVQVASGFLEWLEFEKLSSLTTGEIRHMRKGRTFTPKPPAFPRDEIEWLIADADKAQSGLEAMRKSALVLTLADTGMRISELCALKRGDIDFHEARAMIVGKGKKPRVVRFSERSLYAIKAYLELRGDGATGKPLHTLPLFTTLPRGKKASTKALSVVTVRVLIEKASGGKVHPHHFRHRFVTELVRQHGQAVAQQIVGHERADTTARYTHLTDDELDRAYSETFNA